MTQPSARAWPSALVASLLVLLITALAHAEPYSYGRDKNENTFTFSYDAKAGDTPQRDSYTGPITRGDKDKVDFYVYVNPVDGATIGQRLSGDLDLRLARRLPVRYDGIFTLKIVSDMTGEMMYTDSLEDHFVLRFKPGQKAHTVHFAFDLPSGDYSAKATFAAT
ncbi:MAG: hypothetical protein QOG54_1637 [Actinomycetota bacterium]|jgi:hypothetical protein|nr:hypothetical protein [Actinomycetota bacterium]